VGLFKDIRNLKQQAAEISESYDSKANLERGMGRMREAQQMMTEQTQAATMAASAAGGVDATAVIAAVAQTTTMVNFQPSLRIDLTVMPAAGPPYPATVTQTVPQLYLTKAVPGQSLPIRVDPHEPGSIWIDWAHA
jgi:hypothetical protein